VNDFMISWAKKNPPLRGGTLQVNPHLSGEYPVGIGTFPAYISPPHVEENTEGRLPGFVGPVPPPLLIRAARFPTLLKALY
jgi:hypothetical protein